MYINGKAVGSGMWSLESALSYCKRKGVKLESAYSIAYDASGAATDELNLITGAHTYGNKRRY